MAQTSSIEWTESTWNPVVGCSKVSAGCKHCYAERMAQRLAAMAESANEAGDQAGRKAHYLHVINDRGRWNGSVRLVEDALGDPLRWKRPRIIFVNSMSDLFHKDVPDDFIVKVFETMNLASQHVFQVLTKRPERASEIASQLKWTENIWLGTSVENRDVQHRISHLRTIPAKTRFLSVEPLLGPIARLPLKGIDWVIVGGESGPGARPMNVEWVRKIRNCCIKYNVPFFFKQWGGTNKKKAGRTLDGETWSQMPLNHFDSLENHSEGHKTREDMVGRATYSSQAQNTQGLP